MCYGQILEAGLRRARKAHRCTGCGRTIRPGTEYERVTGVHSGRSGEFWESHWHRRCAAMSDVTEPYDFDGCMIEEPRDVAAEHAKEAGWRALLADVRRALAARGPLWARERERRREAARKKRAVTKARTVRVEERQVPEFEE